MKINCAKVTLRNGPPRDPGREFEFYCKGGECKYRIDATIGCKYMVGIRCNCQELMRDWLKENAR